MHICKHIFLFLYIWQDAGGWLGKRQSFVNQTARGVLSHGPQVSPLWSTAGQRFSCHFNIIHLVWYDKVDFNVISHYFRCVVKRARALSLARCMFQHCYGRHWGLPWVRQPAYLPGDPPPTPRVLSFHTFPALSRLWAPLKCVHMAHVCLLQVRVEKDKVIIRANKQVKIRRMVRIYAGEQTDGLIDLWSSKPLQALQSQKRSKPMARCSAVINSSTGFSHVLIIGSGLCFSPPSLLSSLQTTIMQLHWISFFSSVISLLQVERPHRSSGSGVCRDAEARGLYRSHRHVHHGQTSSIWQA